MAVDVVMDGLRIVTHDDDTVLDLAPLQGLWTETQYLKMTDHSRRLPEFIDGYLEVLPMPTDKHQVISRFLLFAFYAFLQPRGGTVVYAPLRMQIRPGKFREPDLLLFLDADDPRRKNEYWLGADLVVEIVSPDDPERDTRVKRADYAEAGIPEYWSVDPRDETVTVLTLEGAGYTEHGVFHRGAATTSTFLPGFVVDVTSLFDTR